VIGEIFCDRVGIIAAVQIHPGIVIRLHVVEARIDTGVLGVIVHHPAARTRMPHVRALPFLEHPS